MKIKSNLSGFKPGEGEKVAVPDVIPITPDVRETRRKRKTCLPSWTCCDWTLAAFIIILTSAILLLLPPTLMGERGTIARCGVGYMKPERTHAECKVVHVREIGFHMCMSTHKHGMNGDQLEHGWWDWMENSTQHGWQKNGFFMMPEKIGRCPDFEEFEKNAYIRFKKSAEKLSKEELEKTEERFESMLKEKYDELCSDEEHVDLAEIPAELIDELLTLDDEWEEKAWIEFEKAIEGMSEEEIEKERAIFEEQIEERRRGMCRRFLEFEKKVWEKFMRWSKGKPRQLVEKVKRHLERFLAMKRKIACGRKEGENESSEEDDMSQEDLIDIPNELIHDYELLDENWEDKEWQTWKKTMEGKSGEEIRMAKEKFEEELEERRRGKCKQFIEWEKKVWERFIKWEQGKPRDLVEKVKRKLVKFLAMKKAKFCGRREDEQEIEQSIPHELIEHLKVLDDDWEKQMLERLAEFLSEHEVERKIEESRRAMCRRFKELEKMAWERFRRWARGKPREEVERIKRRLEHFLKMKERFMCRRKDVHDNGQGDEVFDDDMVNKGNIASSTSSHFPCHEIVVEVNPKGNHKNWTKEENNHWHGKGGDHGPPRHHPHHGGRSKDSHDEHDEDMGSKMRHMMKEGHNMMDGMKMMGREFEKRMEEMMSRGVHHATLYDSKYTAQFHTQCSVSICKDDQEQNKKCVGNFVSEFKQMWTDKETFPCYFEPHNKMQVFELEPHQEQRDLDARLYKSFNKTLIRVLVGLAAGWVVLVFVFIIRRILNCRRTTRGQTYQVNQVIGQVNQINTQVKQNIAVNEEKVKEAALEKY